MVGTAGTPTAPATLPSRIANIILPPNTVANENNFAEIPFGKTITGTVFLDYDGNASLNGTDYGLSGIVLTLTGTDVNGAPVSASTTTASNGTYIFTGLPAGTYTIVQSAQPTGTTNGVTTAGAVGSGIASNPTATTSQILNINLTGAPNLSAGNDFAEIPTGVPDVTISKTHTPTNFAAGTASGNFIITPSNVGSVATTGTITVTDTLPAGITLAATPTGTGWSCTGTNGSSSTTCTSSTSIAPGSNGNPITLRVRVAVGLTGQVLLNSTVISGGGEPPSFTGNNTATDTVAISATGAVSGTIWRDVDHDRILDAGEERVSGWTVELLFNGVLVDTRTSLANGTYSFTDVAPGTGYEIRFREPTTNVVFGAAVTNERGNAATPNVRDTALANPGTGIPSNPGGADTTVTTGTLKNLTIYAGDNVIEQSLPLDPAGVVYNAVTRQQLQGPWSQSLDQRDLLGLIWWEAKHP